MISSLQEEYETIVELGADLIGASAGSLESHAAFRGALRGCPFPLASDADRSVAQTYDAMSEDGRPGVRSMHIVYADLIVIHGLPWYRPGNVGQFMEIFQASGME